ncbi:GGDEF domain-containing protein [Curvibacter gracilis]|uniref:GGDEF domain-containing protein n=1 Tax=Curvibacter gracilis TaxID=230310 RepID=UPI0004857984|nr:GGDEF domain-containing protein [Curvibacter gracilis]
MNLFAGLTLDTPTLVFSIGALALFMSVFAFNTAFALPARDMGLRSWGRAMLALCGGFMLFFLRGHAPLVLTFLLANVLVLLSSVICVDAHARLLEQPTPWRRLALVNALGALGTVPVYLGWLPRGVAIFAVSMTLGINFAISAHLIWRRQPGNGSRAGMLAAGILASMAGASALRGIYSISGERASVLISSQQLPQVGSLLLGALFTVGSSLAFLAMINERQQRELEARSRRDGLTGLLNRTAFFEAAHAYVAEPGGERFGVVMMDIDWFKKINDRYGHAAGDTTLTQLGRLITQHTRLSDLAGRYGGEEFCLLLKDCTLAEAQRVAQQLVSEAARQSVRLPDGGALHFTLSAGYAQRQGLQESLEQTINRADQALYEAKHAGRNRAVAALPIAVQESVPASPQGGSPDAVVTSQPA